VDETEALVARNNLAEEEAETLSKFNAEIIGHNNPGQRILYVDRIRRELSEVKQVSIFIASALLCLTATRNYSCVPATGMPCLQRTKIYSMKS
jgi:hypothetical protein